MSRKKLLHNLIFPAASLAAFVAVWWVTAAIIEKPYILPEPSAVFYELFALTGTADFYAALGITFLRSFASFGVSLIFAALFALLSQFYKPFKALLEPIVSVLRSVPTMSVILIAIVSFPSSVVPVLVGALVAFPVSYSAIETSLSAKNCKNLEMCEVFRIRKRDVVRSVYFPGVAYQALEETRTTLPLTFKVVIAGEVLTFPKIGMGVDMQIARINVETAKLLAWTVAAVLLCFLIEWAVAALSKTVRRKYDA